MKKSEIRKMIKSIAPELKVRFAKRSEYDIERHIVFINPTDSEGDFGFIRHLREVHKCEWADKYPEIVWTILHEVGHYFTIDEIDESEKDFAKRVAFSVIPLESVQNNPNLQDDYFNLPAEWAATEWAIQYLADFSALAC